MQVQEQLQQVLMDFSRIICWLGTLKLIILCVRIAAKQAVQRVCQENILDRESLEIIWGEISLSAGVSQQ